MRPVDNNVPLDKHVEISSVQQTRECGLSGLFVLIIVLGDIKTKDLYQSSAWPYLTFRQMLISPNNYKTAREKEWFLSSKLYLQMFKLDSVCDWYIEVYTYSVVQNS